MEGVISKISITNFQTFEKKKKKNPKPRYSYKEAGAACWSTKKTIKFDNY